MANKVNIHQNERVTLNKNLKQRFDALQYNAGIVLTSQKLCARSQFFKKILILFSRKIETDVKLLLQFDWLK